MSYATLLADSCVIQRKSVLANGKTDLETFSNIGPISCRVLKRSAVKGNVTTAQYSTVVSTRFVLPKGADVLIRDRILHEGRVYDVIEVVQPFNMKEKHHVIAICEAIAGDA